MENKQIREPSLTLEVPQHPNRADCMYADYKSRNAAGRILYTELHSQFLVYCPLMNEKCRKAAGACCGRTTSFVNPPPTLYILSATC